MNKAKQPRALSESFLNELKNGRLKPVLDRVKQDNTLCLEIRNNEVHIYYRGGRLLEIAEKGSRYDANHDWNYWTDSIGEFGRVRCVVEGLKSEEHGAEYLVEVFPKLKCAMDVHCTTKKRKFEKEFQQVVIMENNYGPLSNKTDYFFCDMEYSGTGGLGRVDLVGARWLGNRKDRKENGKRPRLAFFEMKYGDNAFAGKAGICDHVKKFESFLSSDVAVRDVRSEMNEVVKQKCELGLFDNLSFMKRFEFSDEPPMCVLLLANISPVAGLKNLKTELKAISMSDNIFVATCSYAGYAIFDDNVLPLHTFLERVESKKE